MNPLSSSQIEMHRFPSELGIKRKRICFEMITQGDYRKLTADQINSSLFPNQVQSSPLPIKDIKCELSTHQRATKRPNYQLKWNSMFEELKKYKQTYGDCIVPRGFPLNPKLASWVSEQRKQYKFKQSEKKSAITDNRIALLNEVGFAWNAQESAWLKQFEQLIQFKHENGSCIVPVKFPPNPKLGLWVKEQRRHYWLLKDNKPSQMTPSRIEKLDTLEFCWDAQEANWREKVQELKKFKERWGHCKVPRHYDCNPALGTWVHHQRTQYKLAKSGIVTGKQGQAVLSPQRQEELDALGFTWYPRPKRTPLLSKV